MTEASIRSILVRKLRQYKDWVVIRHEDHYTSGIPDISVTGNKITSWWEMKLWRDAGVSPTNSIQQFTLELLAKHGYAYYIIYHMKPARVSVHEPKGFPEHPIATGMGYDHSLIVQVVRQLHGLPL